MNAAAAQHPDTPPQAKWSGSKVLLVLAPLTLLALLAVSMTDAQLTQTLFARASYYFLLATVLIWAGTYLCGLPTLRWPTVAKWIAENWPGLLIACAVTIIAALSVEPALRLLSDEANLVGTSKNLFATKTATMTVSGKHYYGHYFDVDVAIDQRPTLFPFLVSLLHTALGYSYKNAFVLNLLVLPAFVLSTYRLGKSLAGERLGALASILVVAHPIFLISVRSAGFDFLATFFLLLVLKSFFDYARERSPAQLAMLWLNACLLANVRYESALFIPLVVGLLLRFKMLDWATLRPFAFVYALTPAYLLPRIWQSMLRGNVPKQEPGTITFSLDNFVSNALEYFAPLLEPARYPAHSAALIGLGVAGVLLWLWSLTSRTTKKDWRTPPGTLALLVIAFMILQSVIVFAYVWGRAQYPSAARLLLAHDTFFSFAAAWFLTTTLRPFRPLVAALLAVGLFAHELPVAAQARMMNRLTQTRESAATWSYFEKLNDERILIVTDRPNHFTIMNYGAMSFETARSDAHLFTALSRRLFSELYVIQRIQLSTGQPFAGYETWPNRRLESVFEFQNDADVLVRISRVAR